MIIYHWCCVSIFCNVKFKNKIYIKVLRMILYSIHYFYELIKHSIIITYVYIFVFTFLQKNLLSLALNDLRLRLNEAFQDLLKGEFNNFH